MMARCAAVAEGADAVARDQREANVFRLAAMIVLHKFPVASKNLMAAGMAYLAAHPGEQLEAGDLVRRGWVVSFPRLNDSLVRLLGGK